MAHIDNIGLSLHLNVHNLITFAKSIFCHITHMVLCVCVCVCLLTQSCLTHSKPMDWSLPGSSVHGDSPGKNTGVGCHAFFQGIFQPRDQTQVLHIAGLLFTIWAIRETHLPMQEKPFANAKNPPANAGDIRDMRSTPGSGRCPKGRHGNLLQYSCLENSMDRGA